MRRSRATSPDLRVAEVAVGRALHDRLGAVEPEVRAVAFGHREVRAADEEEPELRLAQLLVELRVAASRDVDLESIGRLLHDLIIEGAARGELVERRCHVVPQVGALLRLPPLLAELPPRFAERVADDRVRALL